MQLFICPKKVFVQFEYHNHLYALKNFINLAFAASVLNNFGYLRFNIWWHSKINYKVKFTEFGRVQP